MSKSVFDFIYYWYFSPLTVNHIRNGIDILVGTPGRIKDHLQSGRLDLSKLRHVVLDEVDQMLDLGFAEQVEDIIHESYKTGIFWLKISTLAVILLSKSLRIFYFMIFII